MTDRYVRGAGGAQLYVRDFGGEGPTLLLISTMRATAVRTGKVAPMLVPHLRVLAMDVRRHGRSEGPPDGPYDLPALTADAIAVLDNFGVDGAHMMAQSMGGRIGYALTAGYPERRECLVMVDMGADPSPGSRAELRNIVPAGPLARAAAEA